MAMLLQDAQSEEQVQLVVREQSDSALSARQGLLDRLHQEGAEPAPETALMRRGIFFGRGKRQKGDGAERSGAGPVGGSRGSQDVQEGQERIPHSGQGLLSQLDTCLA